MATLVYSDVDGIDRSFSLGPDPITVGRAAECAIRSDDPRVSRLHARFFMDQGKLWVEDLGSSNGIYVGTNKVTKSQVPTGEIVLVGSLMIRLLPASGTLPPPVGIHGTLAQWLDMERKARAAVEEERDAFAQRVNEIHQQLAAAQQVQAKPQRDPDLDRELMALRQQANELARVRGQLDEAKAARGNADAARQAIEHEQMSLRAELDELRRSRNRDQEDLRAEVARANEAKNVADTQGGLASASKLAEADLMIAALQNELGSAKKALAQANADPRLADLNAQVTGLTGRVDKAEKELAAAQIRAQGAERNLGSANQNAAKADGRSAQLASQLDLLQAQVEDEKARATAAELALADLKNQAERLAATTMPSMQAPIDDERADKLAAELADVKAQFDTRRDRIVELEAALAEAQREGDEARRDADAARRATEAAETKAREAAVAARADAKKPTNPPPIVSADQAVAAMRAERDAALAKEVDADRRSEDAEKRASAADTMAKAMAKDVAEALRRAVEADSRAKAIGRELANVQKRAATADDLDKRLADADAKVAEALAGQRDAQAKLEAAQKQAEEQIEEAKREAAAQVEEARTGVRDRLDELQAKVEDIEKDAQAKLDEARREGKAAEEIARNEAQSKIEQIQREAAIRVEQAQREANAELDSIEDAAAARVAQLERELAAERSSAMALVDRRGVMEREISELRTAIGPMEIRADQAERRAAELDVQVEMLQDKVTDLESALAIEKTASSTSVDEARAQLTLLEARATELDGELRRANAARGSLEDALAAGVAELAQLKASLEEAEAAADESQAQLEATFAKAEQAELANQRATAVQRQLDEALAKIAWQERDASSKVRAATEADAERATAAEKRATDAEAAARDSAARIEVLEREVEAADNVRQFAAATEREIAQLQRELREARKQVEENKQRVTSEGETTGNFDPEVTAQADIGKYEEMIKKSSELEQRAARMEREEADLRRRLNETEAKLRAALEMIPEDDAMRTIPSMPGGIAEHLAVLEESIDSLRSNMRAASDETAVMAQTESVVAVASAVSNAAEHIERARDALRALIAVFDR